MGKGKRKLTFEEGHFSVVRTKLACRNRLANKWLRTSTIVLITSSENAPVAEKKKARSKIKTQNRRFKLISLNS